MDVTPEELLREYFAASKRLLGGRAPRDAARPSQPHAEELFLAELKERRENLKRLIQAISEHARQEQPRRPAVSRHRCHRTGVRRG